MALREAIEEVLSLQPAYSSANTEDMQQRGRLIRHSIPETVGSFGSTLADAAKIERSDLLIEGRDGTGLKAEVPWVRFASRKASPSATGGWYVVLLHRRDGAGVYLTLAHGSTNFRDGALIARPPEEIAQLMAWARGALGTELLSNPRATTNIDLGTLAPLAAAYQKTSVLAYYYPKGAIPPDDRLREDMAAFARMLGRLYEAERLGQIPQAQNPEVRDAVIAAEAIANPNKQGGQGFALTAAERRVIELRAMLVATEHLQSLGYSVKDVSAKDSFDLEATNGTQKLKVEVKGTTGDVASILLTRNEVDLHLASFPNNALLVVHSIQLVKSAAGPSANGGILRDWLPWKLDQEKLKGITFSYSLGD